MDGMHCTRLLKIAHRRHSLASQYFMELVMKDIFATIRKTLETAGWRALDVTKRETVRAREDLRKIYAKTWSDRGHL